MKATLLEKKIAQYALNSKQVLELIKKEEGQDAADKFMEDAIVKMYKFMNGGKSKGKKKEDFDPKDLSAGAKVELEHVSDKDIATKIAMDHLSEDPDYYRKLKTIED